MIGEHWHWRFTKNTRWVNKTWRYTFCISFARYQLSDYQLYISYLSNTF